MPTNHTTNYQLSQWAKSDKVLMDDFNADNAKIDAALKAEADARTAAITNLAQTRNCRAVVISYTGTGGGGQDGPNVVTFDHRPLFIHMGGEYGAGFSAVNGQTSAVSYVKGTARYLVFTWSGNTVSWYESSYSSAEYQMNVKDRTYRLFAVLEV